jgi:hypothetical protein
MTFRSIIGASEIILGRCPERQRGRTVNPLAQPSKVRVLMMFIVEDGGVELDESGLINKDSLYEFQESLVELAHWDELVPE